MKTDTITLQNFDNIDSIIDKLNQLIEAPGSSHRILLIWPRHGRLLTEEIEFAQLRAWAAERNCQIAIVPNHPIVQMIAADQNIETFPDRKTAERENWRMKTTFSAPTKPEERRLILAELEADRIAAEPRKPNRHIEAALSIIAIAIIAGLFYLIIPQAVIHIKTERFQRQITAIMWTNETLSAITLSGGIPSQKETVTLDLSVQVPSTGIITGEKTLSTGTVTIENISPEYRFSPRGMIIMTEKGADGVTFQTLQDLPLQPGQWEAVRIEAIEPGNAGNLPAGSLILPESAFLSSFTIRQDEPTTGGSDGKRLSPSREDYQKALSLITDQIPAAAHQLFDNQIDQSRLLLTDDLMETNVVTERHSPDFGFIGDTLTVFQQIEVSARSIRYSDLDSYSKQLIQALGNSPFADGSESYTFSIVEPPIRNENQIEWTLSITETGTLPIDKDEIIAITQGKTPEKAAASLGNYLGPSSVASISLFPSWFGRMPFLWQNIHIEMDSKQ